MLMDAANTVFWGVITFSILIVLHEGGHFAVARAFGVKVHEFMIGLPGPAVRLATKSGTVFGITAIPLGGYVRIAGMEPGSEDPRLADVLGLVVREGRADSSSVSSALGVEESDAATMLATLADWGALAPSQDDDVSYLSAIESEGEEPAHLLDRARSVTYRGLSIPKRILVLSAGVLVNLLAAIAVFTFVLSIWGYYEPTLTIAHIVPDSAAQAAGLREGDVLTSLQGEPAVDWMTFSAAIASLDAGEEVTIGYLRDGSEMDARVALGRSDDGRTFLGVGPESIPVDLTVLESLRESVSWVGLVFVAIMRFFDPSTFESSMEGARSIVGISVEVTRAAEAGPLSYAWIVALLSLSLGVMNILPIPPLDGGKVLIEIVQGIAGRPVERRIAIGMSVAGAVLLFSFIGYVMYADVMRYFVTP